MTELIKDRYQLLDKLGQGGFGAVWRAFDNTLNREVAIKLLNLANENQEEMVARFKTESRVASSFEHQNILRVYDFGQDEGGRCFLVSELLKGRSLHDDLKPKDPLPLSLTLDVLYQVSSALEVAHQQKTVHRDIKPPNIFLNEPRKGQGYVKLLDFGIAKVLGGKQESLTVTGQIMGTPHYMSPEQIVNIKLVDHRSDIYSLGIVFYQMLMGVVPFDDESYFSIMKHQMQSPMPKLDLPQYPSELVSELQDILKVMTHKDVRKRCADASQILSRVEQIWRAHPSSINSLNTGQFPSITAEIIAAASASKDAPSEGIEQMLEPFNDAEQLVDQLLSEVEPVSVEIAPSSDDASLEAIKQHQDAAPPNKEEVPPQDQQLSPASSVQAPLAEPLAPAHSSVATISEQPTTFSPTPMIAPSSRVKWYGLALAGVALGAIAAWRISANPQTDIPQVSHHLEQDKLNTPPLNEQKLTPLAERAAQTEPQDLSANINVVSRQDAEAEIDLSDVDLGVIAAEDRDSDVSVQPNSPADSGVTKSNLDAGVHDTQSEQEDTKETQKKSEPESSIKAKAKTKTKVKPRSKLKTKRKQKKSKRVKKRKSSPKISGKIRLSPDSVSYDLGQTVRLRFPSSTKNKKGTVKLSSCARWVSKSNNKIKFTKTGKCTLSACYGKDCIKSDVINVVEPLF